tara:strand:+ start:94 stop:306 length:213 start_codon:yes stop_codon:yes gene_type:complete
MNILNLLKSNKPEPINEPITLWHEDTPPNLDLYEGKGLCMAQMDTPFYLIQLRDEIKALKKEVAELRGKL